MDFTINKHRTPNNLFYYLSGNFDDNSARLLADRIMLEGMVARAIFIDTEHLNKVTFSGKTILEDLIGSRQSYQNRIVFTGKHCKKVGWQGCRFLNSGRPSGHICRNKCKNCKCKNKNHRNQIN